MVLTKEQVQLLKLGRKQLNLVLKDSKVTVEGDVAWELWFAYDAISTVYHQIRDAALEKKAAKETV